VKHPTAVFEPSETARDTSPEPEPELDAKEEARRAASAVMQDLVQRARNGDTRAFEKIVRTYRPRIFALSLHLTGRASDADDVTQEVFLRVYRKLSQFEGRSELYTWLYRIALHRAINLRRQRGRHALADVDDPRVLAAVAVDAGGDPERAVELKESYARLVMAFDQLSPVLRTTVALVSLQGMAHKEAASVLGTTEGTVAWRIHEARRRLRLAIDADEWAVAFTPTGIRQRAPDGAERDTLDGLVAHLLG
jgi:RNA polymerase sigma-70 factor, ECF subfamily